MHEEEEKKPPALHPREVDGGFVVQLFSRPSRAVTNFVGEKALRVCPSPQSGPKLQEATPGTFFVGGGYEGEGGRDRQREQGGSLSERPKLEITGDSCSWSRTIAPAFSGSEGTGLSTWMSFCPYIRNPNKAMGLRVCLCAPPKPEALDVEAPPPPTFHCGRPTALEAKTPRPPIGYGNSPGHLTPRRANRTLANGNRSQASPAALRPTLVPEESDESTPDSGSDI